MSSTDTRKSRALKEHRILSFLSIAVDESQTALQLFKAAKTFNRFLMDADLSLCGGAVDQFKKRYEARERFLYNRVKGRFFSWDRWVFLFYKL